MKIKIFYSDAKKKERSGRIKPLFSLMWLFVATLCLFSLLAEGCVSLKQPGKKSQDGCASCHLKEKVVPEDHSPTRDLTLGDCLECHDTDTVTLTHKIPLSHIHQLQGIGCVDCHGPGEPQKGVGAHKCLSCHEMEKIIKKTRNIGTVDGTEAANPHKSHYGPSRDCDLCHHLHRKSENFCGECHDFEFVVPSPVVPLNLRRDKEPHEKRISENGFGINAGHPF
jgi:hypothetical protein